MSAPSEDPARPSPTRIVLCAPAAAARVGRVAEWLAVRGRSAELVILSATAEAAAEVARAAALEQEATFGWYRTTLGRLGEVLAGPALARRGLSPSGALPLEALCARIVHEMEPALGRFGAIADRPGLPRALARTIGELRLAGIGPEAPGLEPDLGRLLRAFEDGLSKAGLADRARVLGTATSLLLEGDFRHHLVGKPIVCLDVPIGSACERDFLAALARRAGEVLFTVPTGDERTLDHATRALGVPATHDSIEAHGALGRLQAGLFSPAAVAGEAGDDVVVLSAPGESRECVEIARLVQREAARGARFDRMAIALRSGLLYLAHLEEALDRAGIPSYFARGRVRPDPAGRALVALLACAEEGLSARRFAEYLSLGQLADVDQETIPIDEVREGVARGARPAPRSWERLLADAAVIGERARWTRRLDGHREKLRRGLEAMIRVDARAAERIGRDLDALSALRQYALPLIEDLQALLVPAPWGQWLGRLSALATRSLGRPDRVLSVLAELAPMASVGPVDLADVRLVLERRLTEIAEACLPSRLGKVFVAPIEEVRGMAFDVVFVPGLAERLFPRKVTEDPLLRDGERRALGSDLSTNAERSAAERLALRLAVGAARRRVVLSYPRLDTEQARPRTPSFYGLEVLRAAEGRLPGWGELGERAQSIGEARLGWPAPSRPELAIDAAEHDLALLGTILGRPEAETIGTARYLLSANVHLARALRFRARRWNFGGFTRADGLVDPVPEARAALEHHRLVARSFSPTALQQYAACPYRFVLYAIHKLAPREQPAPLEELDALERGSLVHETQFQLLEALRRAGLLPVTPQNHAQARARLDDVLAEVAARYKEDLAPAIGRVWDDGITSIRTDLREWLRRATEETRWVPVHFELSFGLPEPRDRDPRSADEPVLLDCGIRLRGSIDLVERAGDGALRATDHKTGKVRASGGTIIGGGETLQPVLYALALEKLFPGEKVVGGTLYYCTSAGGFTDVTIALDEAARRAVSVLGQTIDRALSEGFLPAAPAKKACEYCDYLPVCGPYEELRTTKAKNQDRLAPLHALRSMK